MKKLLVIAGPTASGKSGLALRLAERVPAALINADSMQVYAALPVLTAQPSAADRQLCPHALYGVLAADQLCSAGRWQTLASAACESAWAEDRLPILVGGTGLYLRALLQGLSPIPEIPAEIRGQTRTLFAELGNQAFHQILAERDPVMAARLDPGNSQRLMRAWEVLLATGQSLADWQRIPGQGGLSVDACVVLLAPPRDRLVAACDRRLARMLEIGALAEVAALMTEPPPPESPLLKALGFAEFARHLRGECSLDVALAQAQQATRRYAKRQMTWFRHQIIPQIQVTEQLSESLIEEIFVFIRDFLLTAAI